MFDVKEILENPVNVAANVAKTSYGIFSSPRTKAYATQVLPYASLCILGLMMLPRAKGAEIACSEVVRILFRMDYSNLPKKDLFEVASLLRGAGKCIPEINAQFTPPGEENELDRFEANGNRILTSTF